MPAEKPESALIREIEALLLDVRRRFDARAGEAAGDVVVADELFVMAGQLEAVLRGATEHLHSLRELLDRQARES
jgi:hypothetical protein